MSNLGFWGHMAINILSTALLGASNYTMQCLSAPTRTEIDQAHAKGVWLDVGIPSLRNLWNKATHRRWIWWALILSTIPLHLLWNSAVFITLASEDIVAWVVPSDFALYNTTVTPELTAAGYFKYLDIFQTTGTSNGTCLDMTNVFQPQNSNYDYTNNTDVMSFWGSQQGFDARQLIESKGGLLCPNGSEYQDIMPDMSYNISIVGPTNHAIPLPPGIEDVYSLAQAFKNSSKIHQNFSSFYHYPLAVVPTRFSGVENTVTVRDMIQIYQEQPDTMEHLSVEDCFKQYRGAIYSRRKNVLMISEVNSTDMLSLAKSNPFAQAFPLNLLTFQSHDTLCPWNSSTWANSLISPFACDTSRTTY